MTLTPALYLGKRQLRDEAHLIKKAEAILQQHRVGEFLSYCYEYQDTHKLRLHANTQGLTACLCQPCSSASALTNNCYQLVDNSE